jgi:threonyl-tRNA synthetase
MKILLLHSDYVEFEPKQKAMKSAEAVEMKKNKVEECLVVFTAVEKSDEKNPEKAAENLVKEVKSVAGQVKAKNIVLYPYAHLSRDLSSPETALDVLKKAENLLKNDFSVSRAPFGWYKEFTIKCKGHPLAELSRELKIEILEKEAEPDVKKLVRQISKSKLDTTELKENDHRILGQKLDLFSFNETAPGMVFWHNNGLVIYNELIKFWREEHRKAGYQEISTPHILDKKLWQLSGHWDKYKENIFLTEYEKRMFAVKPMNCPGGMLVFKSSAKSYRDLPLRVGELGIVHRQELSGVLSGLFRVIKFTQDDAHIYCTEEQLESEIAGIMNLIDRFYKKFGFEYHVELSTRPEKRIGEEELWNKAEGILKNVLEKRSVKFKINEGDGAFYGPKIDFHIKDSLGRTWQCATIQLDFAMPERFELEYNGQDNSPHRPIMLHRVIYGSVERFIGVLLEHLNGNLPLWLSPIQARVLSFTERNENSAKMIFEKLLEMGIRVDVDLSSSTVNDKVRTAELMKIPYIIVLGDKEEENKTLAVRKRGEKPKFGVKTEELLAELQEKIEKRE